MPSRRRRGRLYLIPASSIFDVVTIRLTVWCRMTGWKRKGRNMYVAVARFKDLPWICRKQLRKTTKTIVPDIGFHSRDLRPVPSEEKSEATLFGPTFLVWWWESWEHSTFYYLPSSFRTYIDFVRTGLRILVVFMSRQFHKKTVNTCFTCLVALTSPFKTPRPHYQNVNAAWNERLR